MKRVIWLTDIHVNFLLAEELDRFLREVVSTRPDALLIGGDMAESHNVCEFLLRIHDRIDAPIYFVLGNHDFYFGSVRETRERVFQLCEQHPRLRYLSVLDPQELTSHIGLVGHDGWADGRLGDYPRSLVVMHDSKLIADLAAHDKEGRWTVLKALADEAAAHIRRVLPLALEAFEHVLLLTHVPPFREACWHEGRISDDQWLPHFTCQAMGQTILEFMAARPDRRLTVLCGHTHGAGETWPLPNVHVITAGAVYGKPAIARTWDFD